MHFEILISNQLRIIHHKLPSFLPIPVVVTVTVDIIYRGRLEFLFCTCSRLSWYNVQCLDNSQAIEGWISR